MGFVRSIAIEDAKPATKLGQTVWSVQISTERMAMGNVWWLVEVCPYS